MIYPNLERGSDPELGETSAVVFVPADITKGERKQLNAEAERLEVAIDDTAEAIEHKSENLL